MAVSACDAYDSDLRRTQDSIVRTISDYQPSRQSFNVTATTSGPQPQLGSPTRQSSSRRTSQRALDSFLCPHAEHGDAEAEPRSSPIAPRNASTSTLHRPSKESPLGPNTRTSPHPGLQAFLSRGQGSASGSASSLGPTPSQTRISHPKRSRSDRYSVSSSQVPPHGSGSVSGSIGSGPAHGSPGPAVAESSGSAANLPRTRTLRHPHLGPGRVASSMSLSDLRGTARVNGGSCTNLYAAPGAGPAAAPVVPPGAASGSLAAMATRGRRSRLSTELNLGAASGPGATKSSGGWSSGPVPHVDVSAASKASVGASAPPGASAVLGAYRSPIVFERHDVRVTGLPPSCLTAGRAPRALGPAGNPMAGAPYSLEASGRTLVSSSLLMAGLANACCAVLADSFAMRRCQRWEAGVLANLLRVPCMSRAGWRCAGSRSVQARAGRAFHTGTLQYPPAAAALGVPGRRSHPLPVLPSTDLPHAAPRHRASPAARDGDRLLQRGQLPGPSGRLDKLRP